MPQENSPTRIEISYKTVVFTVFFLIGLWLLIQIKEIIILIFLSIILLSALLRPVEWLNSRKIPRVISVIMVYIVVIALIAFAIGIIVPPLISQTQELASKLPQIVSTINNYFLFQNIGSERIARALEGQFDQFAKNIFGVTTAIFSSVIWIITLFVFTFYLLLEWKSFIKLVSSPFSGKQEKMIASVVSKVERGLGHWIRGQLTLSLIVGILTYIGLRILDLPFALPLALIAGILEIIPIVGPIISAIPAILVGLSISPILALAAAALFFVVQQLENHLIVPMVMSKVVGLQPPVVIIALLVGAKLAGIGGAFLAVPIIVVAKIVFKEVLTEDQNLENDLKED